MNLNKCMKKVWIRKGIAFLVAMSTVFCSSLIFAKDNTTQTEKDVCIASGVNIKVEELGANQIENLNKLCKVWGFVKYYHPRVIEGTINWDEELFKIMPVVLKANTPIQVDGILYDWINKLGEVKQGKYDSDEEIEIALSPSLEWTKDTQYVTPALSKLLIEISKTYISERDEAYASFDPNTGYVDFSKEESYETMDYTDEGYKLLSLFRYWNIIQYYYPYRVEIQEDWNKVLTEFIPKFIACNDRKSYILTISELTTKIHDAHAYVGGLYKYLGTNCAPLTFDLIEGKIVVIDKLKKYEEDSNVKVGDIILKVNGKDIGEVIKEKTRYVSLPREDAFVLPMRQYLLSTSQKSIMLTLERDGKEVEEAVKCYEDVDLYKVSGDSHKLLEGNIGYINPGTLARGEIDTIMSQFMDTKGLVIDLRYYPSDFIVYSLGKYLMPKPVQFAKMTFGNPPVPGEYVFVDDLQVGQDNPNYYKGKVIILINQCTQSQAEFTTMALQNAPRAQVIGSHSIGTDGNVFQFILPGKIYTAITGWGVYYPDKSPTQRIGIIPDLEVKPTIRGIQEGKDELIEKAIEMIKE